MGSMFLTLGDNDHAIGCLLRASNYDMANPDAHYYLGVGAANKGHLDDAVRFFGHALELDPGHLGALRDSAFTYVAADQMDKAAARIADARALLPRDCELRMLDYSVRAIRLVRRFTALLRKLDPRRLFHRRR
jgi:tetratricopeptide (TPR) repeat protein